MKILEFTLTNRFTGTLPRIRTVEIVIDCGDPDCFQRHVVKLDRDKTIFSIDFREKEIFNGPDEIEYVLDRMMLLIKQGENIVGYNDDKTGAGAIIVGEMKIAWQRKEETK